MSQPTNTISANQQISFLTFTNPTGILGHRTFGLSSKNSSNSFYNYHDLAKQLSYYLYFFFFFFFFFFILDLLYRRECGKVSHHKYHSHMTGSHSNTSYDIVMPQANFLWKVTFDTLYTNKFLIRVRSRTLSISSECNTI